MSDIYGKYIIGPMSVFLGIQGSYLLWLGVKTHRAGLHPPPLIKMPFRTRIQTGTTAKITAMGYLFAALCNFGVIVLLFIMR